MDISSGDCCLSSPPSFFQHHRLFFHFHPRILYRHPGDDLPCPLVWLGSLRDHDPLVRGPAGAPGDDPGTRHGVGVADQRYDDADDAYHDAGGAPAGLHPDRLGQRFAGTGSGRAPCPQERLDPGHHRGGHPNTLDGGRGGDHRDRFRPSRAGHVDDRFHLFYEQLRFISINPLRIPGR